MATKTFSQHVSLYRDAELVQFKPGDELPAWAEDRITNPDVFAPPTQSDGSASAAQSGQNRSATGRETAASNDGGQTPENADELDALKLDDLKTIAGDLGLSTKGKKDDLKGAIRAKRAETPTAAVPAGAPAGEQSQGVTRDALEARAREKGIEIDADLTYDELEALIEEG